MARLPRIGGKEIIAALKSVGFEVVPVHTREIIGPGLMTKILRACELSREEFKKLL
jgi:predicted RNA binding protein YcfA (HicA-like mRNA interferase family)